MEPAYIGILAVFEQGYTWLEGERGGGDNWFVTSTLEHVFGPMRQLFISGERIPPPPPCIQPKERRRWVYVLDRRHECIKRRSVIKNTSTGPGAHGRRIPL